MHTAESLGEGGRREGREEEGGRGGGRREGRREEGGRGGRGGDIYSKPVSLQTQ